MELRVTLPDNLKADVSLVSNRMAELIARAIREEAKLERFLQSQHLNRGGLSEGWRAA